MNDNKLNQNVTESSDENQKGTKKKNLRNIPFLSNLIGFFMTILGAITSTVLPYIGIPILLFGIILFISILDERMFVDYASLENDNNIYLLRKRYYVNLLMYTIAAEIFIAPIISLFTKKPVDCNVRIYYKTEYFTAKAHQNTPENVTMTPVTRDEYKVLKERIKQSYINKAAHVDVIDFICSPQTVNLKSINAKFIACVMLAIFLVIGIIADPAALFMIPFPIIFIWLSFLLYPDYKEAKFKSMVYNEYFKNSSPNSDKSKTLTDITSQLNTTDVFSQKASDSQKDDTTKYSDNVSEADDKSLDINILNTSLTATKNADTNHQNIREPENTAPTENKKRESSPTVPYM
ncbi:MAG: hypothetical protein IKB73_00590 [Ruminococcus sp.]|nr:hypothetical protein [Ruminococcus sp.]